MALESFRFDGAFYHHDIGHGHDHDHEPQDQQEDGLWVTDNIEMTSVGIDIGSAGTQVLFSVLRLRRMGEDLSSRYIVIEREPIYLSEVSLTPYLDGERIDGAELGRIIDDAYRGAGIVPARVDTGVVILTGEAIRRQNAEAIATALSEMAGEFVCVTAGHHMESLLAAFGSGAALRSREAGSRILNVDIGGGTVKLAVVQNGRVVETAALYLGGRLLAADPDGSITRLEPGGKFIAGQVGLHFAVGDLITPQQVDHMTDWMAHAMLTAIAHRPLPPEIEQLYLTPVLQSTDFSGGVMFSGGVGEYVYDREARDFGDLGRSLGRAIRREIAGGSLPWTLLPPGECIRATAVGASEHTVQVSGNTIYLSEPTVLPLKNLPVLSPPCDLSGDIDPWLVAGAIHRHLCAFELDGGEADLALAFHWRGDPDYARIRALAQGIVDGMSQGISRGRTLFLVFESDIARTMGLLLKRELHVRSEIVIIDSVSLKDFDYIDLGRQLQPSGTVPVTIKSLLFHFDPGAGGGAGTTKKTGVESHG